MSKVLVLYYSSYGHVEAMAQAVAEGARSAAGTEVDVRRVAELVSPDVANSSGYRTEQFAPILTDPNELVHYDAIIIGTPTRYGNMAAQMKNFLDQTGGLWFQDKLVRKVGACFTSTATQHGGQESTLLSTMTVMLHLGMIVVGLPYSFKGQLGVEAVKGGTPYGASTIAGGDGSRMPSEADLEGARFQGHHVASVVADLVAGRAAR